MSVEEVNLKRIYIFGSSGVGKSTLGKGLSETLGLPFTELDALHHQPGWTSLEPDLFRSQVENLVLQECWIIDGAYSAVRDLILPHADTLIFLDYSRTRVLVQLLRRTIIRGLFRTELWNGNRERLHKLLSLNPEENVVLWSMQNFKKRRVQSVAIENDLNLPANLRLRFRHPRETSAWLDSLGT